MKIVHICLAASYIEGFGYQENILPQFHVQMGHEVTVLTSDYTFNSKYEKVVRENKDYINQYGMHILTLPRSTRYGIYSKFNDFDGVYDQLVKIEPDVIFVHGGQFVALKDVLCYCKRNKSVKLFIDQHGDYYNMSINTWQSKLIHCLIYGHWMRKAVKICRKFWGVTPWRCQYLQEVYGIPKKNIGLLIMGGDDRQIHFDSRAQIRANIRSKLDLRDDDFVIITGGKIDSTKNIHLLMQAVIELNQNNLKLVVFGQPNDAMEMTIQSLAKNSCIRYIGWLDSQDVYDYFMAADLVAFPGTHSVLWEQACAAKVPCLFKRWEGMQHVDVGGNCDFIDDVNVEELKKKIQELVFTDKYKNMKTIALSDATNVFLYSEIAKKSIECASEQIS